MPIIYTSKQFLITTKRIMKKAIASILLFFFCFSSFSQQSSCATTLKQLTDSIRAIVKRQNIPGLMVGITTKDSVIFSGGFGYADINAKRPVNSQTLFRMGSITKMFVSLAILKLAQEGKLSLNDELKKVAPEVPFENKWESTHPVRIVNLLEHTTGFDDMKLNHMCSQDAKEYTGIDMVVLQKNSLICRWKPGERFSYCNPGYVVLGYIIQKITGSSYDQYINENILQPLGMNNSNFNLLSKFPGIDVKQYVVHGGQIKQVPSVTVLMGPAGSLWSCSDDMLKFLQMFLKNGAPIFPGSIINEMETPHSSLAVKAGLKNGYALANANMRLYNAYSWRGHGGLMGTCFSSCIYSRELGVGFVLSSNGNQPNYEVENLIAEYLEQNAAGNKLDSSMLDIKAITPFLGQYQFESPRNEISGFKDKLLGTPQVYIESNGLYLKSLLGEKRRLFQTAPLTFADEWAHEPTVIFTKNEEGKNVAFIDGGYFEQTSYFKVAFTSWITVIVIFFAGCSFFPGIVSLTGILTGKLKWQKLPIRVLPMIATALLVWAVLNLLQVQNESYLLSELTSIDARTLIIFSGTLLFGIFSVFHLIFVIRKFRQMKNYWFAFYWLITALSLCYISFVLFQNGWIGMRTWAM
jgi:CubicO group peptidase (beta-lactamase class C family)